ncbi:MAG: hypothetical protein ABWY68_02990, partial [Cryobacterium sp.]
MSEPTAPAVPSEAPAVAPAESVSEELPPVDGAAAVERLRAMIRVPTISRLDESLTEWARFDDFVALLPQLFPATHSVLTREIVAGHSLLYRWAGRRSAGGGPGAAEDGIAGPTVLMAHYDVVAADAAGWQHP